MNKSLKLTFLWTAFFFSLGHSLTAAASSGLAGCIWSFILDFIFLLALMFGGARLFRMIKAGRDRKKRITKDRKGMDKKKIWLNSRLVFWLFLMSLILSWLPAFLAFYPGTFGADAPVQLAMLRGETDLTLHHPILHTLAFGLFYYTGSFIFRNPSFGIAAYIFLAQILFTAFAMAKASVYLYRRGVPFLLLFIMMEAVAFNPIVQTAICYTTKDIPFAAALLLFMTATAEFLFPPRQRKYQPSRNWKQRFLSLIFWGVMMCLLRNQGIYMVLAGIFFLGIIFRKNIRRLKIQRVLTGNLAVIMVAFILGTWIPSSVFSIPKGDSKEMLSVPLQQIISVIYKDETEHKVLDDQTRSEALSYFSFGQFDPGIYNAYCADYPKIYFRTSKVKEDPGRFWSLYWRLMQSDPETAFTSAAVLISPYFDMRLSSFNPLLVTDSFTDIWPAELPFEEKYAKSVLPGYRQFLIDTIRMTMEADCPFWLRIYDPALVLYFIIFLLGYGIFFRKELVLTADLYPVLYVLTMLLGPVALLRYSYVYVVEAPFLAGVFWLSLFKSKAEKPGRRNPAAGFESRKDLPTTPSKARQQG